MMELQHKVISGVATERELLECRKKLLEDPKYGVGWDGMRPSDKLAYIEHLLDEKRLERMIDGQRTTRSSLRRNTLGLSFTAIALLLTLLNLKVEQSSILGRLLGVLGL